jgi:hypothetical protein
MLRKIALVVIMAAAMLFSTATGGMKGFVYILTMPIVLLAACKQPDENSTVNVASVTLNKTTLNMTVGDEETLIATIAPSNAANQNFEWSSSAPSVVEVVNGKVTAKTVGSGSITVTTQDGNKTATCAVTVSAAPSNTVATPTATPPEGTYNAAQTVILTTETEGAAIHYTLDGTEPTTSSPVYNSSLLISHSSLIKAIAVKSGMNTSAVLTATYTIATSLPEQPPEINDITITGATPEGGKYKYTDVLTLTGNPAAEGYTYAWTCSPDTLSFDKTAAEPAVSGFAKNTSYTFTLTITKGELTSTKSVTVSIAENKAPTITAAGVTGGTQVGDKREFDFTSARSRSIQLAASATDADSSNLTYAWTCTKYPDGAAVPAIGAGANPTVDGFNKLGDYEFKLTVTDGEGGEAVSPVVKVVLFRTATATVGVQAINQTGGDTKLPFTPTYTSSNTTDFPVANMSEYITYKVTAKNDSYEHTWTSGQDGFDGQVPYRTEYDGKWTTFTQVFYDKNGNEITGKNRVVISVACSGSFLGFGGDSNFSADLSIPGVSGISLSKKVTEGNVQ